MPTYIHRNLNSDLSGGADWDFQLTAGTAGRATKAWAIAAGATETNFAWTNAGTIANHHWQTGVITVELDNDVSRTDIHLKMSAARVNSSGAVQETTGETGEQTMNAVQVFNFTIPAFDWTVGSTTDRLRINYIYRNSNAGIETSRIGLNTTDSQIVTVLTETAPVLEPGHLAAHYRRRVNSGIITR